MVKPYRPGIEARREIMVELLRRKANGEGPATLRVLAAVTNLSRMSVSRHARTLTASGLVRAAPEGLSLTAAGEEAAKLIP